MGSVALLSDPTTIPAILILSGAKLCAQQYRMIQNRPLHLSAHACAEQWQRPMAAATSTLDRRAYVAACVAACLVCEVERLKVNSMEIWNIGLANGCFLHIARLSSRRLM